MPEKSNYQKATGDVFDRLSKKKPLVESKAATQNIKGKDHLKMGLNELIQRDHEERRKEINEKFYGSQPNHL